MTTAISCPGLETPVTEFSAPNKGRGKSVLRRTAALALALLIAVTFAGAVSTPAHAETTLEKLERAKRERERTEAAREDTEEAMDSLRITQNSLLGQLSALNDDLNRVSTNLAQIESDIAAKEVQIANTRVELEEAILTEQTQYEDMKLRIRAMYENSLNDGYLSMLLSSKSYTDFLNRTDYIEQINRYDQRMLAEYKESRRRVEETQARLETELASLNVLRDEAAREQRRVTELVDATQSSAVAYAHQISDAEATIDTLEDMLDEQNQSIAALQKQYEEELALSRLAAQSAWRDISQVSFEEGDRKLLANLIYCEAGGEPYEGQVAVGAVVINRVLSSRYPNTIVGVIYQNKQFSPVASGRLALALANDSATSRCYQAADEAMSGVTNVGQCVYFRTPIEGLTGIRIGGHIFY
ncbi:MAG: cell wall hydrolase [Roseburia sp.]|nr:cell wall hydrolase [Roseburia sp.]